MCDVSTRRFKRKVSTSPSYLRREKRERTTDRMAIERLHLRLAHRHRQRKPWQIRPSDGVPVPADFGCLGVELLYRALSLGGREVLSGVVAL